MFSLIVSAIAIVLVIVLAVAALFHLASPSEEAIAKTQAAQYMQEGGQIIGSIEVFKAQNTGTLPSGSSDEIIDQLMSEQYLKAWPEDRWAFSSEYLIRDNVHENTCKVINRHLGIGAIVPSCDAEEFLSRSVCCTTDPVEESTPVVPEP